MKLEVRNMKNKSLKPKDNQTQKSALEDCQALKAKLEKHKKIWLAVIMGSEFKERSDCKDILQECYKAYIKNRETIEGLEEVPQKSYIFNIAYSKVKDAIKKKIRRRENNKKYTELKHAEQTPFLNDVYNTESQSDFILKQLSIKKDLTLFEYIKSFLPDDQYTAITLWADGNKYKDVAEKMEKQPGQVKGLIERAKKNIRHHLVDSCS